MEKGLGFCIIILSVPVYPGLRHPNLNCAQLQNTNDVFICKPHKRVCSETPGDTSRKLAGVIKLMKTDASVRVNQGTG